MVPCDAVWCSVMQCGAMWCSLWQCAAVCCSVLQCAAVCCSVLQLIAAWCSKLQCVAVCCSACQCVPACSSELQRVAVHTHLHKQSNMRPHSTFQFRKHLYPLALATAILPHKRHFKRAQPRCAHTISSSGPLCRLTHHAQAHRGKRTVQKRAFSRRRRLP